MNLAAIDEASNDVLILGNPNSGKTLLFNRLTGLKHKVANFPGVTVEIRSGTSGELNFFDFPGIYSLKPLTVDETVAVEGFRLALQNSATKAILCVLDATRLERSFYLLLQLIPEAKKVGCPVVVAVNVMDEIVAHGTAVDIEGLSAALGCEIVGISAKKGTGLNSLKEIFRKLPQRSSHPELLEFSSLNSPSQILSLKMKARELTQSFGPKAEVLLKSQNRLDHFFLSSWLGLVLFAFLMLILFQAIFSWAAPFMDFTENVVAGAGNWVAAHLPQGVFADFSKDAVFAGVGSFLVFVPQIFFLFIIIGILEDSGYLARASILLHKPLSYFGLSGRSFVPLLSGHACAIPAIMATRTIESPRKRLLTIIATPFMSCSARLPVYALLVSGFVPAVTFAGGLIGLQGFVFFALFALGIVTALFVTSFLNKSLPKNNAQFGDAPFVVELPPYRWPDLKTILFHASERAWGFVRKAGGVIFAVTVVIWMLGYFPSGQGHLESSYLAAIGHSIEGIFKPLGMDWKIGVAVLVSFLAREVFVGTLGTLYGLEAADENLGKLSDNLHAVGMGLPAAIALLVFYSLAMQCVSTLAVIRKETGSVKTPILIFIGMTFLAYIASAIAFKLTAVFLN